MSLHDTKLTKQQANMLIYGYIHEYETLAKLTVPVAMIRKILEFYPIFNEWRFEKGKDADEVLQIINDDFRVMNETNNNRLCVANHRISSKKCSEYWFEIRLIDFDYDMNASGMMIGIVREGKTSIRSYNTDFSTVNKTNAWTVYLSQGKQFCLYGPGISCKVLSKAAYHFKPDDRIKISLDMVHKKGRLYYNDKLICVAFDFSEWSVVVPAIALWKCHIALSHWSSVDINRSHHII
eukprot:1136876_1